MPFGDIVGQQQAITILRNALLHDAIAHAYLFYGMSGVGKYTTALSFAKALLCPHEKADFCGTCASCRRITHGNHPDVFILSPAMAASNGERRQEPEAGMILVDDIRGLQHWLSVGSFEGGYKVALIDGADRMNPQAANALLRTLEEPPAATVAILISPSTSYLLPTIVSRCRKIYFPPIEPEILCEILAERSGQGVEHAALRAALSEGSIGRGISMDEDWVVEKRKYWIDRLLSIYADPRNDNAALRLAEEVVRSSLTTEILQAYCLWYRDILVCKEAREGGRFFNQDMMDALCSISRTVSTDECIRNIEVIHEARKALDARINPRIALETMFLRLVQPLEEDVICPNY